MAATDLGIRKLEQQLPLERWAGMVVDTANPSIQACTQTEPASSAGSSVPMWWMEPVLAFRSLVAGIQWEGVEEGPLSPSRQLAPVQE